MPIIRSLNPFRKQDENVRPTVIANGDLKGSNGITTNTKPIDIKEKEPTEYKLSEINDSGVFIPPSPPERKSFWTSSSSRSTTSSTRPSLFNENEPFNISRESFDSYRRSFDISARSPVIQPEQRPRASLDSRTFQPLPRMSSSYSRPVQAPLRTQKEEEPDNLEEVSLDDPKPQPPKKRGVFSRIIDSGSSDATTGADGGNAATTNATKSSWHHFGGRKRGQSGQGSELGAIPKRETTPKPAPSHQQQAHPPPPPPPSAPAATAAASPPTPAPASTSAAPPATAPKPESDVVPTDPQSGAISSTPEVAASSKTPKDPDTEPADATTTEEDGVQAKAGAEAIGQTPEVKVDS